MSAGWKFDASSLVIATSGNITAVPFASVDKPYGPVGCNNLPYGSIVQIQSGVGHVEITWNAVADLVTGGEIGGIGHSFLGFTAEALATRGFRGSVHYSIRDANNGLIFNAGYNKNTLITDAVTDFFAVLVDVATYDPALPQYATLEVKVSFSGKIPNCTLSSGEPSVLGC